MNWVKSFYANQYAWSDLLDDEIQPYHHDVAAKIERMIGHARPKKILELGAGGGQNGAAAAALGHDVTAIELVGSAAAAARKLADQVENGRMQVNEGDFYTVKLDQTFNVVCYWDGFGIGSDADQRRLLQRVADWLRPDGCALIDCYTPWYAASVVGRQWRVGDAMRRYDFDADGCRWLDHWWSADGKEEDGVTQSLRCYSPADLRLLLEGTGLTLVDLEPGGTMDWEEGVYHEKAPLNKAISYTAKLIKRVT